MVSFVISGRNVDEMSMKLSVKVGAKVTVQIETQLQYIKFDDRHVFENKTVLT